jgi:ABC-type branched-subunit amino acid transport system substrate-binding protein
MKLALSRLSAAAVLAVLVLVASGSSGTRGPILQPNKLLILSTTDVKGKTGPCG